MARLIERCAMLTFDDASRMSSARAGSAEGGGVRQQLFTLGTFPDVETDLAVLRTA